MEDKYRQGYHITKKNKLQCIAQYGLMPKIGCRSGSVKEYKNILCFTNSLHNVTIWKDRLYKDISYDELVVLTFDLDDVEYILRHDSDGDLFTETTITPDKVRVIVIIDKETPELPVPSEKINEILRNNQNNGRYDVTEYQLDEINIDKSLNEKNKQVIIEELAAHEHHKWSEWQDRIYWHAKRKSDGSLTISSENVERIKLYLNTPYSEADEIYKKEINASVLTAFHIMDENSMLQQLSIPGEDLLKILEEAEYNRINRWAKYMLGQCIVEGETYIISSEKAELWEQRMRTPYNQLSEEQQAKDKKEVLVILKEIECYKHNLANEITQHNRK